MTLQPTSDIRLHAAAQGSAAADLRRNNRSPRPLRPRWAPWLFLLPYFVVTGVFFLYPLIYATVLAF
jgi:hypothetical protein